MHRPTVAYCRPSTLQSTTWLVLSPSFIAFFLLNLGYGRATTYRLMTPWTLMRIGSISKVITAVAVMKLIEQGRFSLQSTVFGPNGQFTPRYHFKVTIRPAFSGTVPIFNDVTRKKITALPGRLFVPFLFGVPDLSRLAHLCSPMLTRR